MPVSSPRGSGRAYQDAVAPLHVSFLPPRLGPLTTLRLHADCHPESIGIRLSTLPIKAGYYRLSPHTTDVRRCPDAAIGCSDNAACDESLSGCRGGNVSDGNGLCHDGLTGVFCMRALLLLEPCDGPSPWKSDMFALE